MTHPSWPPGHMQDLVGSPTVGQHDEDDGLRTDGRPKAGDEAVPKRTKRLFTMLSEEDSEAFGRWATDHGMSKSTASALILRERMRKDGYIE